MLKTQSNGCRSGLTFPLRATVCRAALLHCVSPKIQFPSTCHKTSRLLSLLEIRFFFLSEEYCAMHPRVVDVNMTQNSFFFRRSSIYLFRTGELCFVGYFAGAASVLYWFAFNSSLHRNQASERGPSAAPCTRNRSSTATWASGCRSFQSCLHILQTNKEQRISFEGFPKNVVFTKPRLLWDIEQRSRKSELSLQQWGSLQTQLNVVWADPITLTSEARTLFLQQLTSIESHQRSIYEHRTFGWVKHTNTFATRDVLFICTPKIETKIEDFWLLKFRAKMRLFCFGHPGRCNRADLLLLSRNKTCLQMNRLMSVHMNNHSVAKLPQYILIIPR